MDSRRKAGGAVARLSEMSRRGVLVGASATPALAGVEVSAPTNPSIAICQRWLAVGAESRRLQTAWSDHETWLARTYGWFRLSPSERAAIPEGAKLAAIDRKLDVLEEESQILLRALLAAATTSLVAVIGRLSVAEVLLGKEDHPEVHELIARAVRELTVLSVRK
jgi:hypothetical protein